LPVFRRPFCPAVLLIVWNGFPRNVRSTPCGHYPTEQSPDETRAELYKFCALGGVAGRAPSSGRTSYDAALQLPELRQDATSEHVVFTPSMVQVQVLWNVPHHHC